MNSFGQIFRITTFGESHGLAVGGVIDGMPAGIAVDEDFIQHELDRRRPGQSKLTTARNEADKVELLSGIFEGKTTGQPIGFMVRNTNQQGSPFSPGFWQLMVLAKIRAQVVLPTPRGPQNR